MGAGVKIKKIMLFATVFLFLIIESVNAENINSCRTLSSPGEYVLINNVSISGSGITCIIINSNNITLNCNGYSISGDDSLNSFGVSSSPYSNGTYIPFNFSIVKNCILKDLNVGIGLMTNYGLIFNNTMVSNIFGLEMFGQNNIVSKNSLKDNPRGLSLGTQRSNITNNSISNSSVWGVAFYSGPYNFNLVLNNDIRYGYGGVFIGTSATNNTIANNIIAFHTNIGIDSSSIGNLFYNNYLNNSKNADVPSYTWNNSWNTTKRAGPNIVGGNFIGGNYWSDYTGNDTNGDGFGDTPYNISWYNLDYLPLIPNCTDEDGDGYAREGGIACGPRDCVDNNLQLQYMQMFMELCTPGYMANPYCSAFAGTPYNINPGATEVCDGIDNDCDGGYDEGFDYDNDTSIVCDCDNNDSKVKQSAPEICDGKDSDCNGFIPTNESDADNDGYRICNGDCDDNNPFLNMWIAHQCLNINCTPVIYNGNVTDKIDIVFVGSGFPNITSFNQTVLELIDYNGINNGLMSVQPFSANRTKFNFWIVKTLQNYTNTDFRTASNITASTCPFGDEKIVLFITPRIWDNADVWGYYNSTTTEWVWSDSGGYGAYVTVGTQFLTNSGWPLQADYSVVGTPIVPQNLSYSKDQVKIQFIHEFGHSFGGLFDEYDAYNCISNSTCWPLARNPPQVANCDLQPCNKWSTVTAYCQSPCGYTDWCRSSANSIMRSVLGPPFQSFNTVSQNELRKDMINYTTGTSNLTWGVPSPAPSSSYMLPLTYVGGTFIPGSLSVVPTSAPGGSSQPSSGYTVQLSSSNNTILHSVRIGVTAVTGSPSPDWFDEFGKQIYFPNEEVYILEPFEMTLVLPYFSNTEKIKMFDPEGKSVFELCVNDIDGDGVCDEEDNCWYVLNPDQADSNDNCPEPPYEIDPICGDACEILTLNLLPDPVWAEKTVTATISCSVDCSGKTAYVGRGEKMVTVCYNYTCLANGCSCTFTAPKLLSTESIETYYARIDLDGNKIYDETEIDSNDLTIYCNAKGVSCSSTETCCAGAYCISGTCQYPSGPGCGKNCLMK